MDKVAFALALAFLLALLVFGAKYHPIEEIGSAEIDNYVGKADEILAGTLPHDGFRPLLYPLTVAGVAAVTHDTFGAARAVSSLFAALLVLATYLLGSAVFDRRVVWFAMGAMMLNPHVITLGVHTTTDMMFAALAALTLLAAVRANRHPSPRAVALAGVAFATACFTRYTGVALIPVMIIALVWTASDNTPRRVAARLATFTAVALVCLLPHFVLTAHVFGNPFYNDSWRNLAFKLYGDWDWKYLETTPYRGTLSVILHSPVTFVVATARELVKFLYSTLASLGGYGIAGGLFAGAVLGGVYVTSLSMDRRRAVVLSYLAFYILTVCAFFYTSPRFMFPILPVCYLLGGAFLVSRMFDGSVALGGRPMSRSVPVVVVFLAVLLAGTVHELRQFIARHPMTELRAAQELELEYGDAITIFGTSPFSHRGIDCAYIHFNSFVTRVGDATQSFYERLELTIEEEHPDFIIVGRMTLGDVPLEMLSGAGIPDYLEAIVRTDDVVVYRVLAPEPAP
jgi:hypothetical protein